METEPSLSAGKNTCRSADRLAVMEGVAVTSSLSLTKDCVHWSISNTSGISRRRAASMAATRRSMELVPRI